MKTAFNLPLPNVAITMGFPSRRARTRASNRAPGEILIEEWKGSEIEKALVSIHPERFDDVNQVALSTLFVVGNEVYGSRRNLGSTKLGVQMNKDDGNLIFTQDEPGKHAKATLNSIVKQLGEIPAGFADMPEPKQRAQTNRQMKFVCKTCGQIIRAAGNHLEVLCMHGGRPQHGQMATTFIKQEPKRNGANGNQNGQQQEAASAAPAPAPQPEKPREPKVAKSVPARNFGQEVAAQA